VLRNARFMPHMYILKCSDGSFYVGSTRNLERRLEEHSTGFGAAYTRTRLPVELVFAEEYEHVHEAYEREKQVQGWSRKKRIALIERRADDLPELSKKRRPRSSFTL
jgi:putative endonuclease